MKVKGLSNQQTNKQKIQKKTKNHRHRQQHGDSKREEGWREVDKGRGGVNYDKRRFDFGW